ncbi:prepilin peptidase [Apilactobacillus xinyiensis]|uniref:prepilin peptidase n=1 Tax=Apilactobacillus xinyiensis TaxID=2841032 RepID=UPI003364BF99
MGGYSIFIYLFILKIFLGASVGSFVNLIFERKQAGTSIIFPYSHCNQCNLKLSVIKKIPIMGYIISKGKCNQCNFKIPLEYLLSELYLGILVLRINPYEFKSCIILIAAILLLYMSLSDLKTMHIPTLLIYSLVPISMVLTNKNYLNLIIIGILYILICLIHRFYKNNFIGNGDIDILFIFFIMHNLSEFINIIFISSLSALIYIEIRQKRKVAFIPFMTLGFLINYVI